MKRTYFRAPTPKLSIAIRRALYVTTLASMPTCWQAPDDEQIGSAGTALTLPDQVVFMDNSGEKPLFLQGFILEDGVTYAYGQGDIAPSLQRTHLNSIQARLFANERRKEVQTFAWDPSERASTLRELAKNSFDLFDASTGFHTTVQLPITPENDRLVHPTTYFNLLDYNFADLRQGDFWPGMAPAGPGSLRMGSTGNDGSVKGVYIYDSGRCARRQDLTSIVEGNFDEGVNSGLALDIFLNVAAQLPSAVSAYIQNIKVNWTYVATYIERGGWEPSDGASGGVLLNLNWVLETPFGFNDLVIEQVRDLRFTLINGELRLQNVTLHDVLGGGGLWGDPISNNAVQVYAHDLIEESIEGYSELVSTNQWQDMSALAGNNPSECLPYTNPESQCDGPRTSLQLLTEYGATTFGASVAESDDIGNEVANLSRWRCGPSKRCEFLVPAKRLNPYPNAVELVWFDSIQEYHNAALGLWYAIQAASILRPDLRLDRVEAQLCSPQVFKGPAQSDEDHSRYLLSWYFEP